MNLTINSTRAARLAIAAAILYQVLLIALIFIRPEIDPYWHTISEWAIGRHGWIMSSAFIISALGYGFLFLALRKHSKRFFGKAGLVLLFTCMIGTTGVGIFTTDPYPPDFTITTTMLHTLSGTAAMILLPLAAILINLNLAFKNKAWKGSKKILLLTAGLPLIAFIGFMVHLSVYVIPLGENANGPNTPIGWPPRILFLTYGIWLIILAWQEIRLKKVPGSPSWRQ